MSTSTNRTVYLHAFVSSLALLLSCTAATSDPQPPLISRLAKDPATSLYTITVRADKSPLVVDLAGSLIWSTCPSSSKHRHSTFPCDSDICATAKQQGPAHCQYVDGGPFWQNRGKGSSWCVCPAHPLNPVTGECSTADLTSLAMSANTTTNGTINLRPEEAFAVVGACAPDRLLRSLPAGATGVAGLSRQPLSLPSQLTAKRGFGSRFTLCLPVFATFGDTPVYLPVSDPRRVINFSTSGVSDTPLLTSPSNAGGYYIPVKGISVSWNGAHAAAQLPAGALDLDASTGRGGVALSTVTPYATMRSDVFRAFAEAFNDTVTRGKYPVQRVPAPKPFELCYSGGFPRLKRPSSWDVPQIVLELGDGATRNWTLFNNNWLVEVDRKFCVGIVSTGGNGMPVDGEPAVVIGGKQLENNLLVFDLEKQRLGFSELLDFALSSCGSATFFTN
ncbi:unnamed protein product [Alopecurus aequalis]